jgi:hypothetical protein
MRWVLALLLCALVLSCNGPHLDLPKDQIWTSPHFRYAARADDSGVCSGVVDQLEAHLQTLTTYLGLPWTGGVIDYYKFRDLADFQSNSGCPPAAGGCNSSSSAGPDVRSPMPLHGHELVHIYTRALGIPPALFAEGLAEALSPEGRAFPAPSQSWRDILGASSQDGLVASIDYWGGGWFVTYLLNKFGPAPFLDFYRAAASHQAAAAIAQQFQNVYGLSLDDVWRQAQASSPTLGGVPVWECASAEPIVMGGSAASLADRCDGRGRFAGLELPTATTFTWFGGETMSGFNISRCSTNGGLYIELTETSGASAAIAFPAGKYYVASADFPGTLGFRDASGVVSSDCNSLTPLVLPAQNVGLMILLFADSSVPWYAMPQIANGNSFRLQRIADYWYQQTMVAQVEACDTCQGPCQILDPASEAQLSNGMVLRFTNLTALEGATVVRMSYL